MAVATQAASAVPEDLKPWVQRTVRLGYAAKGIIYALIGFLAFRLAFGLDGGRVTDASGVLRTIVKQPFGLVLIAIIGFAILAYAAWHIFEGIKDTRHKGSNWKGKVERALTIIKAIVYGLIGVEALRLVFGLRGSSADADDYARETMRYPLGDIFLVLVGIGVAVYGVMELWKAWKAKWDDDFDAARARREVPWLLHIGRFGVGARGVILALMGMGLVNAGFEERAAKARGLAESLLTLFSQPSGPWLLGGVAAGLICFGIFQLLHARYARLAGLH